MTVAEKVGRTSGSFSFEEFRGCFSQANALHLTGSPAYCNLTGVSDDFLSLYFAHVNGPLLSHAEKQRIRADLTKQLVDSILLPLGKALHTIRVNERLTLSADRKRRSFQIVADPGPLELDVGYEALVATTVQIARAIKNTPQGRLLLQPNQQLCMWDIENIDSVYESTRATGKLCLSSSIGLNLHGTAIGSLTVNRVHIREFDTPALVVSGDQGFSISLGSGSFSQEELRAHFSNLNTLSLTDSPASCKLIGISDVFIDMYSENVRNPDIPEEEKIHINNRLCKRIFNSILRPLGKTLDSMQAVNGNLTFGVLEEGLPRIFTITADPGPLEIVVEHGELIVTTDQIVNAIRDGGLGRLVLQPNQLLHLLGVDDLDAVYEAAQSGGKSPRFTTSEDKELVYTPIKGDMMMSKGIIAQLNNAPALVVFAEGGLIISFAEGP